MSHFSQNQRALVSFVAALLFAVAASAVCVAFGGDAIVHAGLAPTALAPEASSALPHAMGTAASHTPAVSPSMRAGS